MVAHVGKGGIILAAVHGPLPQAAKELKLAGAGALAGDGRGAPEKARL
jgi:ABC-type transport system involved in cytochrome c biogenesis ATPase subunit